MIPFCGVGVDALEICGDWGVWEMGDEGCGRLEMGVGFGGFGVLNTGWSCCVSLIETSFSVAHLLSLVSKDIYR